MPDRDAVPFVVDFKKPVLFGREHLLEPLHERVKNGSVALSPALTGQGGIGKTQLAALYVHTYRSAYPGGIFWLELADPQPRHILRQIAGSFAPPLKLTSQLNDPDARDKDLAEQWLGTVRTRRDALIVADNLEKRDLLSGLPGLPNSRLTALDCCLLVTTRQRELSGCEDFPVERLPLEAARKLLLSEAECDLAVLDEDEDASLSRVCKLLGGLPLTLKLAGALVREEAARFDDLATALADEGAIEVLDEAPCPLDDYQQNVDRTLSRLVEDSLNSIPQHKNDWLQVLQAVACLPENTIIRVAFLRLLVKMAPGRLKSGDPFSRTLNELYRRNLIEHPDEARHNLRLHPLIHEYLRPRTEPGFVAELLDQVGETILSQKHLVACKGKDLRLLATDLTLLPALPSDLSQEAPARLLAPLGVAVDRQAHNLRAGLEPLVQLHLQALTDSQAELVERLDAAASKLDPPRFCPAWTTESTHPSHIKTLTGHESGVTACAISRDGRRALSGSYDQSLILWDLERGAAEMTLKGHEGWVRACAFSPDGRHALSGSGDRSLFLWDLEHGETLARITLHGLASAGLSPDGRAAFVGNRRGDVTYLEIVEA